MKMLLNLLVVGSQLTWSQTTKKDLSITTLFAYLISRTFSVNEKCFFLTTNQRTVLSGITFQPSEQGQCMITRRDYHIPCREWHHNSYMIKGKVYILLIYWPVPIIGSCFMYFCDFRFRLSCSYLCSWFVCRKAFLARSIALCVADNQRSICVIVVGDDECRVLHQSKLPPFGRSGRVYSKFYRRNLQFSARE
jgi:hypothetical protein